jgi:RIO-like serine/threonine protein kinase
MDNIGCAEEAEFIHTWVNGHRNVWGEVQTELPPEGWTFLGIGTFRSVWRSPSGVAYKVQNHACSSQNNEEEYVRIREACAEDVPTGARLPRCSYFPVSADEGVVAMECIQGKTVHAMCGDEVPREFRDLMRCLENKYCLTDMHEWNVMIEEGTGLMVLIDFGA